MKRAGNCDECRCHFLDLDGHVRRSGHAHVRKKVGRPRSIDGGEGATHQMFARLGPSSLSALRCLAHHGENGGPVSMAEAIRLAIHTAHGDMHDRSSRKCPKAGG